MMSKSIAMGIVTAGLLVVSSPSLASKASKAVSQCHDAVVKEQGQNAVTKLRKVQSRGAGYDVWLNVSEGNNELRTFCFLKRGEVQQIITEEGRWISRHPSRPE